MPRPRGLCNYCIVSTFYAFVSVAHVSSDRGPVHVAATAGGIAAVELLSSVEAFSAGLARRGLVEEADRAGARSRALADRASGAVLVGLGGADGALETLPVDLGDRPAWDRLVLEAVRAIPRGRTAAYGEIARRIGRPGAARAVGGAVGRNPVGLLVPCHRVIAGDGTLGGYGVAAWGGREAALDLKRALLALEGVDVVRGRVSAS
jgi:O-6-methylguanine DNA methyltransferase